MPQGKINSLQLMRAVAVSLVIFMHSADFGVPIISSSNPVDSFFNLKVWGSIGLDLFFVISGFIMVIVLPSYKKKGGWKTFAAKRIIRIIPLYYVLSGVDILYDTFIQHKIIGYQTLIKTLIFYPIFDTKIFSVPVISVGWSLSYEIYFYSLIGLMLTFFKKDVYQFLLFLILALAITGLLIDPENILLKFLTSPILLEFGFGAVCALIYRKIGGDLQNKEKLYGALLFFLGLTLMVSTIFINIKYDISSAAGTENNNVLAFYRVILRGIPCAIFLLGAVLCERGFKIDIPPFAILAGDASYSCYLIHTKLLTIVGYSFRLLRWGPVLYLILIIPLCLLGSIICYNIIERPLIIRIDRIFKYKKPIVMT